VPSSREDDPDGLRFTRRLLEELRRTRLVKGLSVAELSGKSGVHHSVIHRAEKGERFPSIPVIFRICRALGMPMSEVVKLAEPTPGAEGPPPGGKDA
jgi:transcriptional regulator with XRE-family HTH domain